jgi:hypothetical protein
VGSNLLKKINNASQWIKEDLISQHDTLKKSVQNEAIAQNLLFEVKGNLFGGHILG